MTATIKWYETPNDLGERIVKWGNGQQDAALRYADSKAPEIKAHMTQSAPWNNRTWEARKNLAVEAEKSGNDVVVWLVTRAPHGVFLEQVIFRYAGHLEIIRPTMDMYAQRMMNDLQAAYR